MNHWILAAALLAAVPGARAAVAKVTALEVAPQGGTLIIHADQKPDYTVFKLDQPISNVLYFCRRPDLDAERSQLFLRAPGQSRREVRENDGASFD